MYCVYCDQEQFNSPKKTTQVVLKKDVQKNWRTSIDGKWLKGSTIYLCNEHKEMFKQIDYVKIDQNPVIRANKVIN